MGSGPGKIGDDIKGVVNDLTGLYKQYNKELSNIMGPLEKHLDIAIQMREANERMVKSGGDYFSKFAPGGEFSRALDQAVRFSTDFFGSAQRGAEAMTDLATNMTSFLGINQSGQAALARSTALMREMGFESAALAKAIDNQAMAFGANRNQLEVFAASMSKISRDLFINPKKLMDDFSFAQTNFAYNAEKTLNVFTRMEKQSRKTGIEFSTMAEKFGDGLDTFGGATEMAGKLNAILGANVFNPLELLSMDEAERVATIQQRLGERVNIDELGKYELKAIGTALGGMSPLDVRKLLTEGPDDAVKRILGEEIDSRAKPLEGIMAGDDMDKFAMSTTLATNEMAKLETTIKNLRTPLEDMAINLSRAAEGATRESLIQAGAAAGFDEQTLRDNPERILELLQAGFLGRMDRNLAGDAAMRGAREPYQPDRDIRPDFFDTELADMAKTNPVFAGMIAGIAKTGLDIAGESPIAATVVIAALQKMLGTPGGPGMTPLQTAAAGIKRDPITGESLPGDEFDAGGAFIARTGESSISDIKAAYAAGEKFSKGGMSEEETKEAMNAINKVFMSEESAKAFTQFLMKFFSRVLAMAGP